MLADIILKVAGFDRDDDHEYYPRPSLAGPERCIRQMVYWGSNAPKDKNLSDRFIVVLDDSSWHAYLTIDWLNKSAFKVHSQEMEVSVNGMTGHIDGIITDMFGKDRLLEHKALNHFSFEKYWKGEIPLDYIVQCCFYLKGLQKINPDINECVLLIKNKNTSQFLDMLIYYDDTADSLRINSITHSTGQQKSGDPLFEMKNVISDAMAKFDLVSQHIKNQTLPDRQYDMDSWRCDYCQYTNRCWQDFAAEYDAQQDFVVLDEEAAETAKYLLECKMHIREMNKEILEMEKEANAVQKKLLKIMQDNNAKNAAAGEYRIITKLRERRVIDKERIPEDILKKAIKVTTHTIVSIKKPQSEQSERTTHELHSTEDKD